jgi:hypothetical protein
MNTERLGDRAHLPVLGIKVAADLNPHFRIDHLSFICESMYAEKDRPGGRGARKPRSAAKNLAAHAAEHPAARPPAT